MSDDSNKQVTPAKRKPPAAGMGRKKGSLNKTTRAAKDAIASLNHHRGENTTSAASSLLTSVVDIKADGDHAIVIEITQRQAIGANQLLRATHHRSAPCFDCHANQQDEDQYTANGKG